MTAPTPTGLDLEAIEARANAATPGPWTQDDGHVSSEPLFRANLEWCSRDPIGRGERPREAWIASVIDSIEESEENAEFIAHARQDIPDLIAEVRRLRAVAQAAGEER